MRVALTDRFVAAAKSGDEYFDAKVPGLSLIPARSESNKTWWLHFTDKQGRRARSKLGAYPQMPLAAARAAALLAKAAAEDGRDPRAQRSQEMTVATIVETYIAKHAGHLRSGYHVARRLRKNVLPIIGNIRLADLHRRDVNRVLDALLDRDAPAEANKVFDDVRAMAGWAVRRGDLDHNPIAGMEKPAAVKFSERALSEREIAKLWSALPTVFAEVPEVTTILRLCVVTGQRIGEVAGITRGELDLPHREWRLPASRSKNKHHHVIPLSSLAVGIIKEALADADGDRLFNITPNRVASLVNAAQRQIGIAKWVAHDLRRSTFTAMARLGIEPIVIGAVANHRTTTKAGVTLTVYIKHSYEAEKRRALDLWADRLQAIISGKATAEVIPLGERSR